jgi:beta-galactosidase
MDTWKSLHRILKEAILCILISLLVGSQEFVLSQTHVVQSGAASSTRERLLMDFGWRFAFGHAFDAAKDFRNGAGYFSYFAKAGYGDGAASRNFDDRSWRMLDLPHDWAVELPFDPKAGYSHGFKTVGRNFPETSVGWYRKSFLIHESDLGKRISIEFDGVHRNSIVWVNGFYLGEEHSGYHGFRYDITDYLNYGGENEVAVRVDATMEEGWYYEGAGIYRHVWLNKTSPLHVVAHGTFVSSEVEDNVADVTARATITNEERTDSDFSIDQTIIDEKGKAVAEGELRQLSLKPSGTNEFACLIRVANPRLWSVETPYLYTLVTTVSIGGSTIDRYETTFGIRTIRFDAAKGFFLNGKPVLLKGTNNHQDHAGVGTAIPDALQEFRIKRLKEMGSNAYRCSHYPPTPELLDVCDRLGMLVIDENRLMGTNAEHLDLLKRMILRDRNHPCVFIWSLGNEEWAVEGSITGARIASTMQAFAQRLDPTRRYTYPNSGGWGHGISTVIDVMGFNYIFNGDIDKQHRDFPHQPSIGTEETTSRGTRGIYEDDGANAHMEATDRKPSGRSIETGFNFYAARPFLSGLFFWTGFDYRGEPNPFGWPQISSQCGIVDLCGFPKDMFYYLKSWWTNEPVLHLFPHWNWKGPADRLKSFPPEPHGRAGKEGRPINVWAYSNCDEVELILNAKSLGRKTMPKNSHLEWSVNYEPGTLLARGYRNGTEIVTDRVVTTDEAAIVTLIPDRSTIKADGEDVSVITVQVNDSKGRFVSTASNEITFSLEGPGKIIGVGNGDPSSHEPDKYIESVSQLIIEDLKAQAVQGKENSPETGIDFNDSAWPSALNQQGGYDVRTKDTLKTAVIRGSFTLSDFTDETEISLWPKSLGEEQAIYVNGHLIAKNIERDDPVRQYKLDRAMLRKGKNVYAIAGTPLVRRYQYDDLNTDPGIIQVFTPSQPWKRRVFNGLAQVIVQSGQQVGEITLTATARGLSRGVLKIQSQRTALRAAVPTR